MWRTVNNLSSRNNLYAPFRECYHPKQNKVYVIKLPYIEILMTFLRIISKKKFFVKIRRNVASTNRLRTIKSTFLKNSP